MCVEKLFSGEFYTRMELGIVLGMSAHNSYTKLKRTAKAMDKLIQYKTFNKKSSICCKYRLADKPYVEGGECLDPIIKSKIGYKELKDKATYLSDDSEQILLTMYELRDRYIKYNALDELIGINNSRAKIDQLESIGFVFHRRGKKEEREIKLIEYKPKKKIELPFQVAKKDKLLNKVFR